MKIYTLFIATHLAAGLTGVLAMTLARWLGASHLQTGLILASAALPITFLALWLTGPLMRTIHSCERAVATGDAAQVASVGIQELDAAMDRIRGLVQKWAEAAANTREQSREFDRLLDQLDRRGGEAGRRPRGGPIGQYFRQVIDSITRSADSELDQLLASTQELENYTREIARGAEEQSEAVNRTATYVEQMSGNIDSVSDNADAAQQAAIATRDSAAAALQMVRELVAGMDRIRTHVEASESRLRALGDHSQEIGSIVETIGAISSRTDMLALNASIESVRAGEHGRGFAVVAEEVRKLAEQAAQATREVAGLIESIQLETQESVVVMTEERAEVEAEVQRVSAAGETLERISQISQDSAAQVGQITDATQLQLQLTRDVVLAVERISEVAKSNRTMAEEARWTTSTLTKLSRKFRACLMPLRRCVDQEFGGSDPEELSDADMLASAVDDLHGDVKTALPLESISST